MYTLYCRCRSIVDVRHMTRLNKRQWTTSVQHSFQKVSINRNVQNHLTSLSLPTKVSDIVFFSRDITKSSQLGLPYRAHWSLVPWLLTWKTNESLTSCNFKPLCTCCNLLGLVAQFRPMITSMLDVACFTFRGLRTRNSSVSVHVLLGQLGGFQSWCWLVLLNPGSAVEREHSK